MAGLAPLDYAVILGYFAAVLFNGYRASRRNPSEEAFFLAGRRLGKFFQFFLNFGNSADAGSAVSTVSFVYQQGVSGVWLSFQMVFLNPYYWFMNTWFRRVRLVTGADLFEDRLGSRGLALFYAIFQLISATTVIIGLGDFVTYKVCAAIINTPLDPFSFYLVYSVILGAYIVLGGMTAAALNQVLQGGLILVLSVLLLPAGLKAIGGVSELGRKVPAAMFELVGSGAHHLNGLVLAAITLVTVVQIQGLMGNMTIFGSARNEFDARFGSMLGTYAKLLMVILWSFCGLIAIALYCGDQAMSDPDAAWGLLSRRLLGPGLLGLMLVSILAANMSRVAAQAMSAAALFVTNVWKPLRPNIGEQEAVRIGRWTIAAALGLGAFAAAHMTDLYAVVQLVVTVNVPFGAAILLMFFWRRLTLPAVWVAVLLCTVLNIVAPLALPKIAAVRTNATLTVSSAGDQTEKEGVYFDALMRTHAGKDSGRLEGTGRFHLELYLLHLAGFNVVAMSPNDRLATRLFFDALSPLALLVIISLVTRPPPQARSDLFFGKMKTPIGATWALEQQAMEATRLDPQRFDHTKLFPGTAWEFAKWDRVDAIGFTVCCLVSGGIVGLFCGLLRWAGPAH